jgi:hypothetical protein
VTIVIVDLLNTKDKPELLGAMMQQERNSMNTIANLDDVNYH